jgi:transcriptional regulator with XRE-family HTH domain
LGDVRGDWALNWAEEIKRYRLEHSLTQAALAEVLNVDTTTVSRWERGRDEPSLSMQKGWRTLTMPAPKVAALGLTDIIDTTTDIAVLMDRQYRILKASTAHRKLLKYDMSDVAGLRFPMWTDAMHATMAHVGGPEGWWKNGVRRMEFTIMRKPNERAANQMPIYQRVSTITVRDSMGEPLRYAITQRIPKTSFMVAPPQVIYF